jgi:hypothetical protein
LFDDAKSFYDVNVVNETRNKTYERLAKVGEKAGVDEKEMKVLVKMNRMQGVHVTPTVVFDGVVDNSISSSFTSEQWAEWLEKNVA